MSITPSPSVQLGIPVEQVKTTTFDRHGQNKRVDDREFVPKLYKEVAANMEQQFAEMMLEQMGRTIDETPPGEGSDGGAGMDYYKSLQKAERAKAMSAQNTLGLQNMILDQIYPKRMRTEMALKQYQAETNRIHNNLPSYKIDKKIDTIEMGGNDSLSGVGEKDFAKSDADGGSP